MGEPTRGYGSGGIGSNKPFQIQQPMSATWAETWVSVVFPTLFGMAAGALWQAFISPQLTYGLPNPPQGGLLIMMLFSPLLHRWLTPHPQSMWLDYLGGIAALGLPLMFVWSTGMGGSVCGGYLTVVLWIWVQHFVVAISSSSVPIGHLAHHGRQHRCLGWLVALPQPDDVITRCTIPRRWGNPPNAHRRNSP